VITKNAPKAYEATKTVVKYNALQSLVYGFVGLVTGLLLIGGGYFFGKGSLKDETPFRFMSSLVASIVGFIMTISSVLNLIELWNWIAVFEPEIAVAREVLQRTVGGF
jgi:uncharacterized protein YacL